MNILTPYEFSRLYILDDGDLSLHVGIEIEFDFASKRDHSIVGYVAVLQSITSDLHLYIDNVCGGEFYMKKVRSTYDIKNGLIEYAEKRGKDPMFVVDCDKYFDEIKKFYEYIKRVL